MSNKSDIEPLLKPSDVKATFQCSLPQVYTLAADGRLSFVKMFGMIRFKRSDVLKFIEDNYRKAE